MRQRVLTTVIVAPIMGADERSPKRYQFASGVDLSTALTTGGIEYLTVSPERIIAIHMQAIFNIVVIDGQVSDARVVEIDVIDRSSRTNTTQLELIETVGDRLQTATAAVGREAEGTGPNVS